MEVIRARHQGQKQIYIHNDLSGAAHHFRAQIEEKLTTGDHSGIAFEYMACLVVLAFTFEAKINFLGHKLIKDWNERQPFNAKVTAVLEHLKITPNKDVRPFRSVEALKAFRDSIAHGKPIETSLDEEVVKPADEIDRRIDLDGEWKAYCSHENVFNTYDDVMAIWQQLLTASGLAIYDTITHGNSGLTFIERIVEKET